MSSSLNADVFKEALWVMDKAYAPYSQFYVGAAILVKSGQIYKGCNVENAAYPEGLCAEAGAIAAMIADGENRIEQICIVNNSDGCVPPCGGCRQKIHEFAKPETPVFICGPAGLKKQFTIAELLPLPFGPQNVQMSS